MKTILTSLLTLFITLSAWAQPGNNDCSNAINLSYTGSCNYTTYSNVGATNSGDATATCGSAPDSDVWFSIVVPASGDLVIQTERINFYTAMALYRGTCGSLTQYRCSNDGWTTWMPYIEIHDTAIAGETIYLQYWGDNGTEGDFQLCVFEPAPPSNYTCGSATPLIIQNDCNFQTFNNQYAHDSGVPSPPCGNYTGSDIWFTVDIPASGRFIVESADYGIGNTVISAYTGTCGSLLHYTCNDNGSSAYLQARIYFDDPALAGQTIYLRLWKNSSLHGGNVGVCAYEPVTMGNEDCNNALFISPTNNCNFQTYTNTDYPGSNEVTPSCGNYAGAEAWFSTVVPASGNLIISGQNVTIGDMVFAAYTGECGNLTEYACNNNGSPLYVQPEIIINDTSLANDTIYFIAYKYNTLFGGDFNICVFEPSIPTNQNCEAAVNLNVQPDCNFTTFTSEFANTSGQGTPTCGNYIGNDVWFKFTVPSSGEFTVDSRGAGLTNIDFSLYTGSCGNFSEYACAANGSTYGTSMPKLIVSDPSLANQTVFLQVWRNNSINGGTFDLCVHSDLVPEITQAYNATYCSDETIAPLSVYNGQFVYNWYDAPTGGNLLAADTNQYYTTVAGTYYVDATNPSTLATSARTAITLTIEEQPQLVGALDVSACAYETIAPLSVQDLGDVYTWMNSSGQLIVTDTNQYMPTGNGSYSVFAEDAVTGCKSDTVTLMWNHYATVHLVNPQGYVNCSDDDYTGLSITDNGATYNWYFDSSATQYYAVDETTIMPTTNGTYYVVGIDAASGCSSDTVGVELLIYNPSTPIIAFDGDSLHTTTGVSYQWFKDGVAIFNTDSDSYDVTTTGTYYVEVTDTNGCVGVSNEVYLDLTGVEEHHELTFKVSPNPFAEQLVIQFDPASVGEMFEVYNYSGQLIYSAEVTQYVTTFDGSSLDPGVYFVVLHTVKTTIAKKVVKVD